MRIAHVVPSYWPASRYGGAIESVHGLCRALAAAGHRVDVFTTNLDGPGVSDVPVGRPVDVDGVRVRYFRSPVLRRWFWSPSMGAALESHAGDWDLLHLHSVFLWPTTFAARLARRRGLPYVLSPRGMLVAGLIRRKSRFLKSAWMAAFGRRLVREAACLHLTSTAERSELEGLGIPSAREWRVIPNGIRLEDVPLDLPEPPGGSERPLVMYLGRIHWKKGIDRLVRAMKWVPGARLEIIGNDEEGYRPVVERAACEAGVRDRVSIEGPVYGPDKYRRMARASVFVLPSYSENFGNAALEAMAAGCPAVVAPGVGAADLAGRGGLLVCDSDPERLGPALRELLADDERLARMRRQARQTALEMDWSRIAGQMSALYDELAGSKAGERRPG